MVKYALFSLVKESHEPPIVECPLSLVWTRPLTSPRWEGVAYVYVL